MLHASRIFRTAPARILVIGSNGQIGSELVTSLRQRHGSDNVIAADVVVPPTPFEKRGKFIYLDVLDAAQVKRAVVDNGITWVVHNAALMSVMGEKFPQKCLDLNVNGLRNVLEASRVHNLRCFAPSTMAVFSPESGKVMTKDDTILNPTTVYGITKVFLEQLGSYYSRKYGVDFRSVRYPGIISADTLPGGGTTDYAVWMYHEAIEKKVYECPVDANEPLPMMYIPDCLDGTVALLEAPKEKLKRNVYNLAGFSFTPDQLLTSIRKVIPDAQITYKRGIQQDIAHSWPDSLDDSNARNDWGWNPKWNLDTMTADMIKAIRKQKGL
jgi:threonine 3-dehydrogenase